VDLGWLVCFNECDVLRYGGYVCEVGFWTKVVRLPLLVGVWSTCWQEVRVICSCYSGWVNLCGA
jgi:hypothetical protein